MIADSGARRERPSGAVHGPDGPGAPGSEAQSAGAPAADERVFTFDSTHHAMWAEDVAREASIPAEVVPAPLASGARCALALRTTGAYFDPLQRALEEEGVEFRLFP